MISKASIISGQTINTTVILIEPAVNIYNPVLEGHAHDSVTISVGTYLRRHEAPTATITIYKH